MRDSLPLQGRYRDQAVAVKRCKIGKAGDLLSFRQEVTLMSGLDHPGVVRLLAVKALPPGAPAVITHLVSTVRRAICAALDIGCNWQEGKLDRCQGCRPHGT